jgi:hypothetical protein
MQSWASKFLQFLIQRPVRYAVGVGVGVIAVGAFTIGGFYNAAPVGTLAAGVSAEKFEADLVRSLNIRPDPAVAAATPPPPAPPPARRSNLSAIIKAVTGDHPPPAVAAPSEEGQVALDIMKQMGEAREGFRIPTAPEPQKVETSPPVERGMNLSRFDGMWDNKRKWIIQVGAFQIEADAKQRLIDVQSRAGGLLAGADPFTDKVDKGGTTYYRARFGFSEEIQAESACKSLKLDSIGCVTIKN